MRWLFCVKITYFGLLVFWAAQLVGFVDDEISEVEHVDAEVFEFIVLHGECVAGCHGAVACLERSFQYGEDVAIFQLDGLLRPSLVKAVEDVGGREC